MSKKYRVVIVLIVYLYCPSLTFAEFGKVFVEGGYLTGNNYRILTDGEQVSYILGVIDGLKLGPVIDAEIDDMAWYTTCTKERAVKAEQWHRIVDKYIDHNPERWEEDMHGLIYAAILQACPRIPTKE